MPNPVLLPEKMKNKFILAVLLFCFGFFLSGCSIPDIRIFKNTDFELFRKGSSEEMIYASTREAFRDLTPLINDTFMSVEENPRLGKISGTGFNGEGKAYSWTFIYSLPNPEDKNYLDEYTFEWLNREFFSYSKKLFSSGYQSEAYDYLWNDIGRNWLDSEDIVGSVVGFLPNVDLKSIKMECSWKSKKYLLAPIWSVGTGGLSGGDRPLLFNATTGERVY